MKIVSLNIGKIKTQSWRDGTLSALHKSAVTEAVEVGVMGLEGDEQADTKHHGGADKAIFVLPQSSYQRFNIAQPFGFLGENLTLSDLDETEVCLGDRFQIGTVLLEVTQPRSPCWKLGQHASIDSDWSSTDFLKAYSESGRVGFYCRVLAEGTLKQGQSVNWLTRDDSEQHAAKTPFQVAIQSLFLAKQFHKTEADWALLNAVVNHPALSVSWQKSIQALLSSRD